MAVNLELVSTDDLIGELFERFPIDIVMLSGTLEDDDDDEKLLEKTDEEMENKQTLIRSTGGYFEIIGIADFLHREFIPSYIKAMMKNRKEEK